MKSVKLNRQIRNRKLKAILILVFLNITMYYYLITLNYSLSSHNLLKTSPAIHKINQQIYSDGFGGAYITYESYYKCYTQYINSTGNKQWEENGILISPNTKALYSRTPKIIRDNVGGSIIVTSIKEDLLVKRLNSSGYVYWEVEIAASISYRDFIRFQICSDGGNGVIISWYDSYPSDIYAQRINSSGDIQWGEHGIIICDAINDQENPKICSDGDGGVIIAWEDWRNDNSYNNQRSDLYAQRINGSGIIQWKENGIVISYENQFPLYPEICYDENGGAIITWEGTEGSRDSHIIYAQRVDSLGSIQWGEKGVIVYREYSNPSIPLGNSYILYMFVGIIILIIVVQRKIY